MAYQLIVNLITSLNLFFGFLSIIISLRGDLVLSGWFIIFAIFLEIISKKISEPDKEFDSLAEIISFGIAPSVLIYKNFEQFFLWWIFVLFLYLLSSSIRLTYLNIYSKKGLPLSVSAGLVATTVILIKKYNIELKIEALAILIIILSGLQLSNIKYPKFQDLENKKAILFLIIGLVLLNILGESLIWLLFLAYIAGSPFLRRAKLTQKIKSDKI